MNKIKKTLFAVCLSVDVIPYLHDPYTGIVARPLHECPLHIQSADMFFATEAFTMVYIREKETVVNRRYLLSSLSFIHTYPGQNVWLLQHSLLF